MNKNFFNWKQISLELSGSDNSIRKNSIPRMYKIKVDKLLVMMDEWREDCCG